MVVSLENAFFEAILEIFPIYVQIKYLDFQAQFAVPAKHSRLWELPLESTS